MVRIRLCSHLSPAKLGLGMSLAIIVGIKTIRITVTMTMIIKGTITISYPCFQFQENDISAGTTSDTCKMSEPCGWALYVPGSSPRKIYKYTRNIL